MKLIKKIAAIMFAFMMVFTLSSNVNAEESAGTGKIIINQAVDKAEYKIYKLLTLESYDKKNNIYSYKIDSKWVNFFEQGDIKNTYVATENGYVTKWIGEGTENETRMQEFTKKALEYAKNSANGITATDTKNAKGDSVTFDNLGLGYYLVGSSSGALCGLTTTDNEITIEEKNKAPTVEKKVKHERDDDSKYHDTVYVELGEKIKFQISFTALKGVENYVLHDTADNGIDIDYTSVKVFVNGTEKLNSDYNLDNSVSDGCTFDIDFQNKLNENDKVVVTYTGYLKDNAKIFNANDASNTVNNNKAHLSYGHSNNTEDSSVSIYTYTMPVFKYTKLDDTSKKGLGGVEFKLSTDKEGNNLLSFKKESSEVDASGKSIDVYTLVSSSTTGSTQVIKTPDSGYFKLNGLHGEYYLTETKALPGYNKLDKAIKVKVGDGGTINVGEGFNPQPTVEVLNNKGSLLPSTGGMGTTLIYLIGGALVLGSGIVLANKKRAKAK